MNKDYDEMLSAMMDGEIPSTQCDNHLREILSNDELRQTWFRYHLIRDAMQGQLQQDVEHEFSSRIRAILENEPAILSPVSSRTHSFLKPVAGLAIAASVTAAVLIGVQYGNNQTDTNTLPAFASNTTPQISQPVQFVSGKNRNIPPPNKTMSVESPMNRYLVNYNEYRVNSGMRGMLPYVRIVGYESTP